MMEQRRTRYGYNKSMLLPGAGRLFTSSMSFIEQSFKNHQLHHVLSSPGSADLTADVDFSYIRRMAGEGVTCLGPVTQKTFLKNMGVDVRMQVFELKVGRPCF